MVPLFKRVEASETRTLNVFLKLFRQVRHLLFCHTKLTHVCMQSWLQALPGQHFHQLVCDITDQPSTTDGTEHTQG